MRRQPVTPGPVSRSRSILYVMRQRGWLRPRRIGCLLILLVIVGIAALWVLGRAVDGVTDRFRDHPAPVAGSPFDTVAPPRPASSGSPTIDRITRRGKLIVAIEEKPGLAQRSSSSGGYTGFDIAMLDLIAHDLGVDPARTSFKPLTGGSRDAALGRAEADLALGSYAITAARSAEVGIAGPYLVLGNTEYGIGLPPGDPVLRERVTSVLRRAIDDGTWARCYAEYLGAPVPTPPVLR
ncbi:MAG: transporter substrate-binding domain-containing protein [Pseudonocardiaceae bacterium]